MKSLKKIRDATVCGALAALLFLLVGADVASFNNLEEAVPAVQEQGTPTVAARGGAGGACAYDPEKDPVENFDALIDLSDPYEGNLEAPVTLVEFFDPNCPHCRGLHPVLKAVLEAHKDHLRVVYKPIALPQFPASAGQNAALFAAAQEGKFPEMLGLQFERYQRGGLSLEQLKKIAREIGMDAEAMEQQIQEGVYDGMMNKRLEQAREAGLTGVPTVIINGRFVASNSRTAPCLGELIEKALPQKQEKGTKG